MHSAESVRNEKYTATVVVKFLRNRNRRRRKERKNATKNNISIITLR